jgi:hypothetical protein
MKDEKTLRTEDLARTGEDMRGHRTEEVTGREGPSVEGARVAVPQPPQPARELAATRPTGRESAPDVHLFPPDEAERLHHRWSDVQAAFVDEPRRAVQEADGLVDESMKRLAEIFARERETLEKQWDRGDNVTTEDLRLALQRYRSFFGRLLSI